MKTILPQKKDTKNSRIECHKVTERENVGPSLMMQATEKGELQTGLEK